VGGQESVGRRIRASRLRRGLSQAQLALPELSDSYVSLIESGRRTPTPDVLRLLARKLGCSASYLSSGVDDEAQEKIRTTLDYAEIALRNGEAGEARDRYAELLADPALAALPGLARKAAWGHALALESSGAFEEALVAFEALASAVSPDYDTGEWIRANIAISRCRREMGDVAGGVAVAESAFARVTERPAQWDEETVRLGATLATAYVERGDLLSAGRLAGLLIERADALGSPRARMAAYWQAAVVAKHRADYETAVAYGERALALLGERSELRDLSRLRGEYGTLMLLARPQDPGRARDELERAVRELTAMSAGALDIAWCLTELARVEIVMGRPGRAADRAGEAVDLLSGGAGDAYGHAGAGRPDDSQGGGELRRAAAGALIVLAEARLRLGRDQDAAEVLGRATACLERMEPSREAAQGWFHIAELLGEAGTERDRAEAYRRALTCAGL
jgi:transcriptional regulator with XRE-family HTH domain